MSDTIAVLQNLLATAKQRGATDAEAILAQSQSLSVRKRKSVLEKLDRSEEKGLTLRVYIGQQHASVSTSVLDTATLETLLDNALAMARIAPPDSYAGLTDPEHLARHFPELDLVDNLDATAESLIELAETAEQAALSVSGITNSDGASAGWGRSDFTLMTSGGFIGSSALTRHSLSAVMIAGEAGKLERDGEGRSACYHTDLPDAAEIGRMAAEKTVKRLNPRKLATAAMPVIFDRDVASDLLGHLVSAMNGAAIARGASFLKDEMGNRILPKGVDILDNPHLRRGLRSRPFDAEGMATQPRMMIQDGVLQHWYLDNRSARQLGLAPSGQAGSGPRPSASNVSLSNGSTSLDSMIADQKRAILVTDVMGMGVNLITGDYSQGASGFLIENGQIVCPVSEITIAASLREMLANFIPANDYTYRGGIDSPSLFFPSMMVAGQ